MSARGVLAVFCVCLVGCLAELDTAEKDTEWNGDVDADATDGTGTGVSRDCEGHCSLTYPEHTYPRVRIQVAHQVRFASWHFSICKITMKG